MSNRRLIAIESSAGGGSAFLGWTAAELLAIRFGWAGGPFSVALTCGLIGAALGAARNLIDGTDEPRWKQLAQRLVAGLIIGGFAGAIGGSLGNFIVNALNWNRVIGWTVMGAGIGSVEGLYRRSRTQLRNGLIGGAIGGLIGGLLFNASYVLLAAWSDTVGRSVAFIILGACIGAIAASVKVITTQAWLTNLAMRLSERRPKVNVAGVTTTPSVPVRAPTPVRTVPAPKPDVPKRPAAVAPAVRPSSQPASAQPSAAAKPTPPAPQARDGCCPGCRRPTPGNYCLICDLYF